MRRLLAHLVLLTILWGYVAPAALGATEAELPPCCRGNGKHHYAMAQSGRNFHAVLLRTTLAPIGVPEYLGGDKMMDDFCLDEDAGVAYVTTHRENTIDRMSLEPFARCQFRGDWDADGTVVSAARHTLTRESISGRCLNCLDLLNITDGCHRGALRLLRVCW
jgi:hypothetical protein